LTAGGIRESINLKLREGPMKSAHQSFFTIVILLPVLFFVMLVDSGCGEKTGDEPTKYQSQEGLAKLSGMAAPQNTPGDNPDFKSLKAIPPQTPTAKDIDSIIRPALAKTFQDAKLISATGQEAPKRDGEVIEDRLIYAVKVRLDRNGGDALHAALRAQGFSTSPRLGSKPTHASKKVLMSLFETTRLRTYSFVIIVDAEKQQVVVESYRLGSRYDRLM